MISDLKYINFLLENKYKFGFITIALFLESKGFLNYRIVNLLIIRFFGEKHIIYSKYYYKYFLDNENIDWEINKEMDIKISLNIQDSYKEKFEYELYKLEMYYNEEIKGLGNRPLNKVYLSSL